LKANGSLIDAKWNHLAKSMRHKGNRDEAGPVVDGEVIYSLNKGNKIAPSPIRVWAYASPA
jgi:hypothetical protein